MSTTTLTEFGIEPTRWPGPVEVGLGYYRNRAHDYAIRHGAPAAEPLRPPDYYLKYGDKYARRFTQHLRPMLSPGGQAWIDRTFVDLQRRLEQQRHAQPQRFAELEEDGRAFRDFAYGLHAAAYRECGISELPVRDLLLIARTPDVRDLLTLAAIRQIWLVASHLVRARWRSFGARFTRRQNINRSISTVR